jgi:hypothetical protein
MRAEPLIRPYESRKIMGMQGGIHVCPRFLTPCVFNVKYTQAKDGLVGNVHPGMIGALSNFAIYLADWVYK